MKNTSLDESETMFAPTPDLFSHRNGYGGGGHGSKENGGSLLPRDRLAELLGLDDMAPVEKILGAALLTPVAELISNPGKRVRGQLVPLCYRLASDESPPSIAAMRASRSFADAVEFIHLRSDHARCARRRPRWVDSLLCYLQHHKYGGTKCDCGRAGGFDRFQARPREGTPDVAGAESALVRYRSGVSLWLRQYERVHSVSGPTHKYQPRRNGPLWRVGIPAVSVPILAALHIHQ